MSAATRSAKTFTPKQGQYLAYIYAYTRLHRRPPAERDMQEYLGGAAAAWPPAVRAQQPAKPGGQ